MNTNYLNNIYWEESHLVKKFAKENEKGFRILKHLHIPRSIHKRICTYTYTFLFLCNVKSSFIQTMAWRKALKKGKQHITSSIKTLSATVGKMKLIHRTTVYKHTFAFSLHSSYYLLYNDNKATSCILSRFIYYKMCVLA